MSKVVKLRNHIMKAKIFETITDDELDNFNWNFEINHVKTDKEGAEKCWLNCPLLFSECYYYRKLYEIFSTRYLFILEVFCIKISIILCCLKVNPLEKRNRLLKLPLIILKVFLMILLL